MLPEGRRIADLIVAPLKHVHIDMGSIITPGPGELYYGISPKNIRASLRALDQGIASGDTARGTPGIKVKIVAWNGINGWIAGYDHDGTQVGYGHITNNPRLMKQDLVAYDSEYFVGSRFQRQGLGSAMKQTLELYAAASMRSPFRGVGIRSVILGDRDAARRLLEQVGAVPVEGRGGRVYRRIILRPEYRKTPPTAGVVYLSRDSAEPTVRY